MKYYDESWCFKDREDGNALVLVYVYKRCWFIRLEKGLNRASGNIRLPFLNKQTKPDTAYCHLKSKWHSLQEV